MWSILATGYGLPAGLLIQALIGQHAFSPTTDPVRMLGFGAQHDWHGRIGLHGRADLDGRKGGTSRCGPCLNGSRHLRCDAGRDKWVLEM